jgi:hypothetical protein
MTEEFVSQFLKFNSLINPEDKKIYYFGNYSEDYSEKKIDPKDERKQIQFFSGKDLLEILDSKAGRNVQIELSAIDIVYLDSDSAEATDFINNKVAELGLKSIKISSREKERYHFYFKRSEQAKPFRNSKIGYSLHDYYMLGGINPGGPIIPRPGNGRFFKEIPDSLDLFPEELIPISK